MPVLPGFKTIGCYKDRSNRAIKSLEGTDPILDGSYVSRKHPIAKCAVAAVKKGYNIFAVQNGGWCAASATAPQTFDKYGKSTACKGDGEGGGWANQVYVIKGKRQLSLLLAFSLKRLCRPPYTHYTITHSSSFQQRRPQVNSGFWFHISVLRTCEKHL